MNEEKILALLMSENKEDILIGLSFLGNTDYRALLAKWGKYYKDTEPRFVLKRDKINRKIGAFYYKLEDNFYILVNSTYIFCECSENYNKNREVKNH